MMTEADALPEIGVIAKLQLEPGDMLAIVYPEDYQLTDADVHRIHEHLAEALPAGVKPLVFEGGVQLSVIRPPSA